MAEQFNFVFKNKPHNIQSFQRQDNLDIFGTIPTSIFGWVTNSRRINGALLDLHTVAKSIGVITCLYRQNRTSRRLFRSYESLSWWETFFFLTSRRLLRSYESLSCRETFFWPQECFWGPTSYFLDGRLFFFSTSRMLLRFYELLSSRETFFSFWPQFYNVVLRMTFFFFSQFTFFQFYLEYFPLF